MSDDRDEQVNRAAARRDDARRALSEAMDKREEVEVLAFPKGLQYAFGRPSRTELWDSFSAAVLAERGAMETLLASLDDLDELEVDGDEMEDYPR